MSIVNIGNKPRIAVVEDEIDLCDSIVDYLRACGYPAWGAVSAEAFFRQLLVWKADVVVLDIGLPGESGLSVTQHVGGRKEMAVIIVSGRDTVDDRLAGLNCGADRYLVKPVDLRELTANIDAVWRNMSRQDSGETPSHPLLNALWKLDSNNWRLLDPDGAVVTLTAKEYLFVRSLVDADGEVVSKAAVSSTSHVNPATYDFHRLDVLVARLRKKTLGSTGRILPIKTVHGQGFIFTEKCRLI